MYPLNKKHNLHFCLNFCIHIFLQISIHQLLYTCSYSCMFYDTFFLKLHFHAASVSLKDLTESIYTLLSKFKLLIQVRNKWIDKLFTAFIFHFKIIKTNGIALHVNVWIQVHNISYYNSRTIQKHSVLSTRVQFKYCSASIHEVLPSDSALTEHFPNYIMTGTQVHRFDSTNQSVTGYVKF